MPRCIARSRITRSWIAGSLLIGLLLPVYAPLEAAAMSPGPMPCCRRHPPAATASQTASARPAAAPSMACHHHMAQSEPATPHSSSTASPANPEVSFRSLDCCCYHCDCCRNARISVWAEPVSVPRTFVRSLIEPAPLAQLSVKVSIHTTSSHSPRAPPHTSPRA